MECSTFELDMVLSFGEVPPLSNSEECTIRLGSPDTLSGEAIPVPLSPAFANDDLAAFGMARSLISVSELCATLQRCSNRRRSVTKVNQLWILGIYNKIVMILFPYHRHY